MIHIKEELNKYTGFTRREMEQQPGISFSSMWLDFMTEKISLMRWAFSAEAKAVAEAENGVLFCDADICFLAALPEIPDGTQVALSHHEIRGRDEKLYGKYNGGFVWFSNVSPTDVWWNASREARFYEQSALEDVAAAWGNNLYEFPRTQNYGWWRMWQGEKTAEELQKEWSINRAKAAGGSGIIVNNVPLGSVHTHFFEKRDAITQRFNQWVISWIDLLAATHLPARKMQALLKKRGAT